LSGFYSDALAGHSRWSLLHREGNFSFADCRVCCSRPQTSHYLLASFSPVSSPISKLNSLSTYLTISFRTLWK